jgi:2-amino-4-hydroxy-6-hydroxymethyldihydropteridine diphosphokinase
MEQAMIGFGGNRGNSDRICREGLARLEGYSRIHILKVSSLYRTEPVGVVEQDWFINGVVECETSFEPRELLDVLHRIEDELGRVREIRWGPRTLDLDILAYGRRVISMPDISIPHPRLHERRFVLVPLAEISPDWVHPILNKSASELLAGLSAEPGQTVRQV